MEAHRVSSIINSILIDGIGEITSKNNTEPITVFLENGEMAHVKWYRQGKNEYNGKYVIRITYF